jgi:hypothetical protein
LGPLSGAVAAAAVMIVKEPEVCSLGCSLATDQISLVAAGYCVHVSPPLPSPLLTLELLPLPIRAALLGDDSVNRDEDECND